MMNCMMNLLFFPWSINEEDFESVIVKDVG